MSSNFPSPPSGWLLSQVSYQAVLPHPEARAGAAVMFTGSATQLTYSVPVLGMVFTFATPGSFGTFDQEVVEGELASAVTAVTNVLAEMSGTPVADLESQVVITRTWEWVSSAGSVVTTADTMPYP